MSIMDRGVIDCAVTESDRYVLVAFDTMEWSFSTRHEHARMLQDKLNDYLWFIESGQAKEALPELTGHTGLRPVIRIVSKHPYSQYALDFLERIKAFIKGGSDICDLEWTHDGPLKDGFSDDFAFDMSKVYPRLKRNWAADPSVDVALTPLGADAPDYPSNMVMVGVMNSYVELYVQDMGDALVYLTYDLLPEGLSVEELRRAAFENLARDVQYRMCETREPGVYGIVAGGDFEAECLCRTVVWDEVAKKLDDDVVICVPTKDVILLTRAGDTVRRDKMIAMARETLEANQREAPHLVFCPDVFVYSRADKQLHVSKEWHLDA